MGGIEGLRIGRWKRIEEERRKRKRRRGRTEDRSEEYMRGKDWKGKKIDGKGIEGRV